MSEFSDCKKPKIPIVSLFPNEIAFFLEGEKPFRGRQIFKWIFSGAKSFSEMKNLPKSLREKMEGTFLFRSLRQKKILFDEDGSKKIQLQTADGLLIESVLLCDKNGRKTACLSSQAGCGMGCKFCKTGTLGFFRNLSAAEIVEQFLFLENESDEKKFREKKFDESEINSGGKKFREKNSESEVASGEKKSDIPQKSKIQNIVFMGMGEPLLNLAEVRKAISILTSKEGRGISAKKITISTCGIVKGILDLAEEGPKVRLAVSLTSADEDLRKTLMPVAKENSLSELKKAILIFEKKSGIRATLEAVLLGGVNTSDEAAKKMADFCKGLSCNVNLIAWNRVKGLSFCEPQKKECKAFAEKLRGLGVSAVLRMRRGGKICGACGQLGGGEG